MNYRTYPHSDVTVSEVGFWHVDHVDRVVGRKDRR